ncbi:MAG: AMP-binding protein [Betaproteobacteria bacterium]|nr:AMP-binding protein [Betaproteobacteria bacterium]
MTHAGIDGNGLTLGRFLDAAGARFAARPAIVCSDHSYTPPQVIRRSYAELAADVRALQAGLTDAGVRPGEHVAVLLSSFYEWILYLFAVTRLGAVFVPLNPRFGTHELAHVLRHSGKPDSGRDGGVTWSATTPRWSGR